MKNWKTHTLTNSLTILRVTIWSNSEFLGLWIWKEFHWRCGRPKVLTTWRKSVFLGLKVWKEFHWQSGEPWTKSMLTIVLFKIWFMFSTYVQYVSVMNISLSRILYKKIKVFFITVSGGRLSPHRQQKDEKKSKCFIWWYRDIVNANLQSTVRSLTTLWYFV